MNRVVSLRIGWVLVLFAFLDIVCLGMGMGVPIFCILLGLPVGWFIGWRMTARSLAVRQILGKVLVGAALTSGFTLVMLPLVWGSAIPLLFDPTADLANYGIPMILFEPKTSFIGWLVLMIVISPFLQFLMTIFGSHLSMLWRPSWSEGLEEKPAGLAEHPTAAGVR